MKNYIKMLLYDSVPATSYAMFITGLILLLAGCGHNIYLERETTGFRLDIPMGDSTVGFAVGCDKTVRATVRGGASFETSSSNGGGMFSGEGGQSKITQFKSNAQLNEGNMVEVMTSTNVPESVKVILASNLAASAHAPYFPGSILQTKESTIHIGRAAIQSNDVDQIQDTDRHGLDLLVDRTASVIGTNVVNHTLDTTKEIVGTNIVNHTLDTTKDIVGTNVVNQTISSTKDITEKVVETTAQVIGTNIVNQTASTVGQVVHETLNPLEGTVAEIQGTVEQVDTVVKDVNTTIRDVQKSLVELILIIIGGLLLILILTCITRNRKKKTTHKKIIVDNSDSILDETITDEDLKKNEIVVTKEQIQGTKLGFWRSFAKYSMTVVLTIARWIKLIPPDTRKKIIDFLVDQWKSRQAQKAAEKQAAKEAKK